MNRNLFRILTWIILALDAVVGIFLMTMWILSLCRVSLLSSAYFVLFVVLLSLNIIYITYLVIILLINRKLKSKIKNRA